MSAVHNRRTSLRCKRPRPSEMPVAMHYPPLTEPACCDELGHHHQANIVQVRSSKSSAHPSQHTSLAEHFSPWLVLLTLFICLPTCQLSQQHVYVFSYHVLGQFKESHKCQDCSVLGNLRRGASELGGCRGSHGYCTPHQHCWTGYQCPLPGDDLTCLVTLGTGKRWLCGGEGIQSTLLLARLMSAEDMLPPRQPAAPIHVDLLLWLHDCQVFLTQSQL